MKVWFYDPTNRVVHEVGEDGIPSAVCASVRSSADGVQLAALPRLLEQAELAERLLFWMQDNVNPATLPEEFLPLKLHLLKAQEALRMVRP